MFKFLMFVSCIFAISCRSTSPNSDLEASPIAGARNFNKITCTGGRNGTSLVIERSINELPFPTFHISLINSGKRVVYVDNARVLDDTKQLFTVQKTTDIEHRKNIQVTAGVEWNGATGEGYYQEAANGGLSPLPPGQFPKCTASVSSSGANSGSTSCKTYIESCGGRKPVDCSDSYYCIDEVPGVNYPQCVTKDRLVSDRGSRCGNTAPCMKCP